MADRRSSPVEIAWLTGFLDLRADTFEAGADFWTAVTGTTLSARRGPTGQFATLLPADGDACWRVQRLDAGGPGIHLDLHAHDRAGVVSDVTAAGARVADEQDDVTVLASPGGFPFCVVGAAEEVRPAPVDWGRHRSMLDQVCLDVPEPTLDDEIAFWSRVLDAEPSTSARRPEFTNLRRPAQLPLRLLFQRVAHTGAVTAHPDLASTDRGAEVSRLVALGAVVVKVEEFWTVLRAPDARLFCVTERDPSTGQLN